MRVLHIDGSDLMGRNSLYYGDSGNIGLWARIASLPDYEAIISAYNWAGALNAHRRKKSIAILDIGCGIGLFPRQLRDKAIFPPVAIAYDTLDVSPWSLKEHRRNLQPPFISRNSFNAAIEDFDTGPWTGRYDIVWCIHSLYTVSRALLPKVITALTSLLTPDGRCFILLPSRQSAYITLSDLYLKEVGHGGQPYLTAEAVQAELTARGSRSAQTIACRVDHWIDSGVLAPYLNQACLRPDPLTAAQWQRNATFAAYLDEAFSRERSAWCFQQDLSLISFTRF
jgi:SAM-dependent methyltransferase